MTKRNNKKILRQDGNGKFIDKCSYKNCCNDVEHNGDTYCKTHRFLTAEKSAADTLNNFFGFN
jgi:hypothetical protein